MQRQKADVYVKQRSRSTSPKRQGQSEDDDLSASSSGYVARSAFKLLQLDDRYKFLRPGRVIVDLGAAPGGWSQAIVERTRSRSNAKVDQKGIATPVSALDLLPVVDIEGVTSIQGDFLDVATQDKLRKMVSEAALGSGHDAADLAHTDGFVDVVVSDMMANTTGNPIVDTEASLELCRAATNFASRTLKRDDPKLKQKQKQNGERRSANLLASTCSVLVMKYFMSHEADMFRKEVLEKHFHFVKAEKMIASRKESREQFWICIGFKGHQLS
ncbi:related to MRM2-mitochondrial rRNA methyl transferase [Sporisorium scitamineum]|uniref:rRNA methyltransferase 2, mitochondrial n=1 Tax=Sporisorium scitamineum TaxID=49012 RepID=A0A0F7S7L1_9BASI|nr:related to MRM2-mitochondrial rRNA methyl transferase [Sporisorium scitamineum]CDW97319.1 hypothetical protein [Sporisorium scitamineum]